MGEFCFKELPVYLPYILAYKSQNWRRNLAWKVRGWLISGS